MKKLYRSEKDSVIFGICGGAAEYFDIDPTVVRFLTVVVAVLSGIFPLTLGYIVAYFIFPAKSYVREVE